VSELQRLLPALLAAKRAEVDRPPSRLRSANRERELQRKGGGGAAAGGEAVFVLLHVLTSPLLRLRLVTPALLADLGAFLGARATVGGADEERTSLLKMVEAISQHDTVLRANCAAVCEQLLPTLCAMMRSDDGDVRFLCLKILCDILTLYFEDSTLYDHGSQLGGSIALAKKVAPSTVATTAQLSTLAQSEVLPLLPTVLADQVHYTYKGPSRC